MPLPLFIPSGTSPGKAPETTLYAGVLIRCLRWFGRSGRRAPPSDKAVTSFATEGRVILASDATGGEPGVVRRYPSEDDKCSSYAMTS